MPCASDSVALGVISIYCCPASSGFHQFLFSSFLAIFLCTNTLPITNNLLYDDSNVIFFNNIDIARGRFILGDIGNKKPKINFAHCLHRIKTYEQSSLTRWNITKLIQSRAAIVNNVDRINMYWFVSNWTASVYCATRAELITIRADMCLAEIIFSDKRRAVVKCVLFACCVVRRSNCACAILCNRSKVGYEGEC